MKTQRVHSRRRLLAGAALVCAALAPVLAGAQAYPNKPVRVVIGVSPGGLTGTLVRGIAAELAKAWGQSVIVDAKPGAGGVIAASHVAQADPDGYTIYHESSTVFMVNTYLRKNLPFDTTRDFIPVIGLIRTNDVFLAKAALPANNIHDVIKLAREKPGELNYGSFGIGSAAHFDAEKLSLAAGIRMTHIPYKGGANVMKALLSGDVDVAFTGLTAALPLIKQGRLKALAWGSDKRSSSIPDVPTLKELGFDFDTGGWMGWFVPKGTPAAVVGKIAADAGKLFSNPDFVAKSVTRFGLEPLSVSGQGMGQLMEDTRARYKKLFSAVKIDVN